MFEIIFLEINIFYIKLPQIQNNLLIDGSIEAFKFDCFEKKK